MRILRQIILCSGHCYVRMNSTSIKMFWHQWKYQSNKYLNLDSNSFENDLEKLKWIWNIIICGSASIYCVINSTIWRRKMSKSCESFVNRILKLTALTADFHKYSNWILFTYSLKKMTLIWNEYFIFYIVRAYMS